MQKLLLSLLLAIGLLGCTEHHVPLTNVGNVQFAFRISEEAVSSLRDLNFYVFDSAGILLDEYYYEGIEDINYNDGLLLGTGDYYFAAAVNCGEALDIEDDLALTAASKSSMTLASFNEWMQNKAGNYYDAYSGVIHKVVFRGDQTFLFSLYSSEYNYALNHEFMVILPSSDLPTFVSTREGDDHLRVMANIVSTRAGEFEGVQRAWLTPTDEEDEYTFDLSIFEGTYSVSLWVDYSDNLIADKYYNTSSLSKIDILDKASYFGNTSQKDGFWAKERIVIDASDEEVTRATTEVKMTRPFAKYNMQTTDIDKYREYMLKDETLPEPEDLVVKVIYQGFFPSQFNIVQGVVSDALTGYSYDGINEIEGNIMHLASDYIFSMAETFTDITLEFSDSKGNLVSRCTGIRTRYCGGMESTISGNFLTRGLESNMGGGVEVETEWDDDIEYRF